MSCLADFKVLPILDDTTDEIVCKHMAQRDASFLQRLRRRFSTRMKHMIRKMTFRGRK